MKLDKLLRKLRRELAPKEGSLQFIFKGGILKEVRTYNHTEKRYISMMSHLDGKIIKKIQRAYKNDR